MLEARAFREDLELETVIGNITAVIYHQGENFWVVNHFPWYAGGIHQCICTTIRENGEQGTKHYYPVQYNWVDKMVYVGRENIGVEWLGVEREVGESGYRKKKLNILPTAGAFRIRAAPLVVRARHRQHHQDVATLQRSSGINKLLNFPKTIEFTTGDFHAIPPLPCRCTQAGWARARWTRPSSRTSPRNCARRGGAGR